MPQSKNEEKIYAGEGSLNQVQVMSPDEANEIITEALLKNSMKAIDDVLFVVPDQKDFEYCLSDTYEYMKLLEKDLEKVQDEEKKSKERINNIIDKYGLV